MGASPKKINTELAAVIGVMLEKLESGGSVAFSPKGVSMLPMLRASGDTVTLVKPPARLKKGMVALFVSGEGAESKFVLHRLVRIRGEELIFCGDNRLECDEPVKRDAVIGVLTEYESRGKRRSVRAPWYRLYSFWMRATVPSKRLAIGLQNGVYRIWKRLKRK